MFCFKLISNDCTGDIFNGFKKDKTLNKFEIIFALSLIHIGLKV